MPAKGRHAESSSAGFYRDLIIMILGIIVVGAAVFLLLVLLAGSPTPATTTSTSVAPTTTTTQAVTTTVATTTSTTSPTTTTTTVPVRPPEEVHVAVLNSIGIPGAAGRLTTRLAEEGYQTLPPDDYSPQLEGSRIWYRAGFSPEANVLLAFVPDARVEALPEETLAEGADVVIILGTGYEE